MIENDHVVLWGRCLNLIRDNVPETTFKTWFEPIVPLKYEDKALTIGVPSPFFYEFLEEKFVDLLRAALYKEIGEGTQLMYCILTDKTNHITVNMEGSKRSSALPTQTVIRDGNKAPNPMQAPAPQDLDPHLNPNYNFENFIKGNSNEFSRTVGETVAKNPAKTFNPLFLYGPSGVGKTHLTNAIGTRIKELYPEKRVLYVSAHLFQVQYTDSVRTNHFNDFISFYQTIDVLIIDDIQFLGGATQTQQEFFHTFNSLHSAKKQIIISSDKPPKDMEILEERFRSRFEWGLIADITLPDYETRMAILHKKEEMEGYNISEEVIKYIATNIKSNIRELEGAFNKVMASSKLEKKEVTLELAEQALKDIISPNEQKVITPDYIISVVAEHYHVTVADLCGNKRSSKIVMPRQIAMYLCRDIIDTSLKTIGKNLGDRDHTTVMHGIEKIENELKVNDNLRNSIETLKKKINPQG